MSTPTSLVADSNLAVKKGKYVDGKYAMTTVWVSYANALEALQAREEDINNLSNL